MPIRGRRECEGFVKADVAIRDGSEA